MGVVDLIKAIDKADKIISSCLTCEHVKNAENYLENFKEQTENKECYIKLYDKLNIKKIELNCYL
jgi:hypothetical protein